MQEQNRKNLFYPGRDLEAMGAAENYYDWLLEEIRPFIGDFTAEVGAGRGNFSRFLLKTDLKRLAAFEPSENMFAILQEEFKDDPRLRPVNACFDDDNKDGPGQFDSVVYINVLEHIEDDAGELAEVYGQLKPKGYLIVLVPALSFLYSAYDRQLGHYRRYHKSELIDKARTVGFKTVRADYLDFLGIIPWYVAFTLMHKSMSGVSVRLYDRLCIPAVRFVEQIVRPPIGKNLLLVAEKH